MDRTSCSLNHLPAEVICLIADLLPHDGGGRAALRCTCKVVGTAIDQGVRQITVQVSQLREQVMISRWRDRNPRQLNPAAASDASGPGTAASGTSAGTSGPAILGHLDAPQPRSSDANSASSSVLDAFSKWPRLESVHAAEPDVLVPTLLQEGKRTDRSAQASAVADLITAGPLSLLMRPAVKLHLLMMGELPPAQLLAQIAALVPGPAAAAEPSGPGAGPMLDTPTQDLLLPPGDLALMAVQWLVCHGHVEVAEGLLRLYDSPANFGRELATAHAAVALAHLANGLSVAAAGVLLAAHRALQALPAIPYDMSEDEEDEEDPRVATCSESYACLFGVTTSTMHELLQQQPDEAEVCGALQELLISSSAYPPPAGASFLTAQDVLCLTHVLPSVVAGDLRPAEAMLSALAAPEAASLLSTWWGLRQGVAGLDCAAPAAALERVAAFACWGIRCVSTAVKTSTDLRSVQYLQGYLPAPAAHAACQPTPCAQYVLEELLHIDLQLWWLRNPLELSGGRGRLPHLRATPPRRVCPETLNWLWRVAEANSSPHDYACLAVAHAMQGDAQAAAAALDALAALPQDVAAPHTDCSVSYLTNDARAIALFNLGPATALQLLADAAVAPAAGGLAPAGYVPSAEHIGMWVHGALQAGCTAQARALVQLMVRLAPPAERDQELRELLQEVLQRCRHDFSWGEVPAGFHEELLQLAALLVDELLQLSSAGRAWLQLLAGEPAGFDGVEEEARAAAAGAVRAAMIRRFSRASSTAWLYPVAAALSEATDLPSGQALRLLHPNMDDFARFVVRSYMSPHVPSNFTWCAHFTTGMRMQHLPSKYQASSTCAVKLTANVINVCTSRPWPSAAPHTEARNAARMAIAACMAWPELPDVATWAAQSLLRRGWLDEALMTVDMVADDKTMGRVLQELAVANALQEEEERAVVLAARSSRWSKVWRAVARKAAMIISESLEQEDRERGARVLDMALTQIEQHAEAA